MAAYCPRCHRGSWACACLLGFKEKIGSVQMRSAKAAPRLEVEPEKPRPKTDPLDRFKGDERWPVLMNLKDRMTGDGAAPRPSIQSYGKPMGW